MTVREAEKKKVKKSVLRRESILQNALEIFDRQGFANTSLDDIAQETGVKREAIYYYFKNRAEILLNIIRPQSESLVEGLRKIVTSKSNYHHKLYLAVENHLERFDRKCLEMTVSLRDVYLEDARDVRREMDKIWRSYETMWTALIDEGQSKGVFVQCGDPKMVAFGILGMLNWLARWYDPKKSIPITELIETYFNLIAYGLVKPSARPKRPATTSRRVPAQRPH
ncbi:MAG: TetR family transcriptional regulator [Proteobacteria bacterium]|nr:TetR family transcriptional regulator [Pseudomonadota bacterium]